MTRVVILGGTGNFGARIVRALRAEDGIEVVSTGRRPGKVGDAHDVRTVALDIDAADFATQLALLAPDLVIHCVGPFQSQDYRVAFAALDAGAHYLDLADARAFVCGFQSAVQARAERAGRAAISGASTLPALSTAVIESLCEPMSTLDDVEIAIAPGQRAPRGTATLAAVFSYLGRPVNVWANGRWQREWGWMGLTRIGFDFGRRWGALCDVPDLELLPLRNPGLRSVRFHAALELSVQHFALWGLAALRRMGLPLPVTGWAMAMNGLAGWLDRFGGECGGMRVCVVGRRASGVRVRRTWQLVAPALDGPEIPCMAAILLARRIATGETLDAGARACVGLLHLQEFAPEFARWGIRTGIEESAA